MKSQDIYALLAGKFGPAVVPSPDGAAGDAFAVVDPEYFREAMTYIKNDSKLEMDMLLLVSGVDRGTWVESVYHLWSSRHGHGATLKARLDNGAPQIDSVVDLWPSADWHERECYDMFGIVYKGHPDLRRILLPEDWEGHPLRKDYAAPSEYHGVTNA